MKLPGINRLAVQSLGRQDSGLAVRQGASKAALYEQLGRTVGEVNRTFDETIAKPAYEREAVAQYGKAEANRSMELMQVEKTLNNPTGMVAREDIPSWVDYDEFVEQSDGTVVQRTHIPTYEIAKDWYKGAMDRTHKAAIAGMTNAAAIRKMKTDFGQAYVDNYASVLLNAQKMKQKDELATLELVVDTFVRAENTEKAQRTILQAMTTGQITQEDGVERLMAVPGKVSEYQHRRLINTAQNVTELDNLEFAIYDDTAMDFEQKDAVINELQGRRNDMETRITSGKDMKSKAALNAKLIQLYDAQIPMTYNEITEQQYHMNPDDHKTLITANKAIMAQEKVSDQLVLTTLQKDINSLAIPNGETINARRMQMINRVNTALDQRQLSANDAWAQIQRIQSIEELQVKTVDYEMVVDHIYKIFTKGSKSAIGLNSSGPDILNAVQAETDLYTAAREAGPGFDAIKWFENNKVVYNTKALMKNEAKSTASRTKSFLYGPNGMEDLEGARKRITEAREKGQLDINQMEDALKAVIDAESAREIMK